jgi:hypothetical protein
LIWELARICIFFRRFFQKISRVNFNQIFEIKSAAALRKCIRGKRAMSKRVMKTCLFILAISLGLAGNVGADYT